MSEISHNNEVNSKNNNNQNYFLLINNSINNFMELMPEDYEHYNEIKHILINMHSNIIYAAPEMRLHKLYSIFIGLYNFLPEKRVDWADKSWKDMLDTYNKSVEIISSKYESTS